MTQLESSKLSTQTYNFSLEIYGCGGEHTIGTVKNEIAKYWQTDGEEFFEEYMFSWDKPELIEKYSIPEKFQLQDWNELDDLAHLNGPEIMEENTILEVNDYDSSDKISEIVITNEMLEVEPIQRAIKDKEAAAYETDEFWRCADSKRDLDYVRKIWDQGNAPWIV